MTASFETAELDLGTQAVLESWIDYNGHMNVAYYVMAFDHGVDQFMQQMGITPQYLERVFSCVSARVVVPCHHDDFLQPLTEGIRVRDPAGLAELVRRVPELAPGTQVRSLDPLETISV